jgi:tryptophan synthase alpha chain
VTRIEQLFKSQPHVLVAYITAGDPAPDRTASLVAALVRGGAHLNELGVPFSDPIADGPVIQRAGYRALQQGTTLTRVLAIARQIRETSQVPLLLFTYLNPVESYGVARLAHDAKEAGIDGCLLIDASVEEAEEYVHAMHEQQLNTVFLVAPTSSERRLKLVAKYSSGFIYLVSRTGVTGEQSNVSASVAPLVERMREVSNLPLAVGFGVSKPEHVAQIGRVAPGVVVGSAIMSLIETYGAAPDLEQRLEQFARDLKGGFEP